MHANAPIGVFDSGFGGLSVLRAVRDALPGEDLLYCADHAFMPYGELPPGTVRERAGEVSSALVAAGARAIVIACNTATAAAADTLRRGLGVPVVAMEPAVKPAVRATRSGVVGVLATGGTLSSGRFSGLLQRYAHGLEVVTRPCPELVEAVEAGKDPGTRRRLARVAVAPLLARGADVIVLGCTHFAFLRDEIQAAAGPGVAVIDTAPAVAAELARRLTTTEGQRTGTESARGVERFWTTGDPAAARATLARLWGEAPLEHLDGGAVPASTG